MHFLANQFTVLAYYYSALNTNLDRPDPGLEDVARDVESRSIRIRPIDLQKLLPAELDRLYELSLICFREGFLFTPLPREDFIAQYRELASFVRPELVLLAELGERLVGYIFAIPDWLQAQRGAVIDTFIIKTLAVHPDYHGAGVGRLLAARCHEIARGLGYRRAIHALMIDTSGARKLSNPIAQPMRRYALFARKLVVQAARLHGISDSLAHESA
jgi:GNAT superfamily N-acetyltransferase